MYNYLTTHTLIPGPVSTHEVLIPTFLVLEVAVWGVIDIRDELGVRKDFVNDLPGVTVPQLVLS